MRTSVTQTQIFDVIKDAISFLLHACNFARNGQIGKFMIHDAN